jgi:pimeloyl-ACP methyl ester carboxylesterase
MLARMRQRRSPWRLAPGLAAVYLATIMIGGCADRLLLFPSREPLHPGAAVSRLIEHDGRDIEVLVARSPGARDCEPAAYLLELTGNATRAEQVAEPLARRWGLRPVEVWVANYPGYGRSAGPARLRAIPQAALAVYHELSRVAGDRPIILAGNSLGTSAALYLARERPPAGLILQNPPPLQRLILSRYGWWNLWLLAGPIALQVPRELDSLATAPAVTAPAVFLLAASDTIIPPKYQRLVVDAYAGPKQLLVLEGADHNDPLRARDEARLQEALDWLLPQHGRDPTVQRTSR